MAGKKGEKALYLGARLKYPIRITKLYKTPGDVIRRQEPVLQYSFDYTMELPNDRETLELQKRTLTSITDWNAPEDGRLLAWNVAVGDVVTRDRACATVEEACTHEVQFQGLCALCGKDMSEVNWASEARDTDRAPINMTHDQTSLTVSRGAATRVEQDLQRRLLHQRKLSLVVDLDQTIIHACIDPTIGEWQQDPTNPNYKALQDVRRFQLDEGYRGVARGCWYYIKMRPGLARFLRNIAALYELHVYTMGTRTYATNIARIVDPDQKLFANRVISRDENGNIVAKSLQRLFPVSTHMAVIIDDRADVWPYNRSNLIKVTPYDFFKGTGDINSSFLPRRSDLGDTDSTASPDTSDTVKTAASSTAASGNPVQPSVSTATSTTISAAVPASSTAVPATPETPAAPTPSATNALPQQQDTAEKPDDITLVLRQQQAEEQERTIEKQITDRPLLHMQEQLDKEDEAAAATTPQGADADAEQQDDNSRPPSQSRSRHCVLYDDDQELVFLENHLTALHHKFYKLYDAQRNTISMPSKSNGTGSTALVDPDTIDLAAVPDAGQILDSLKGEVLQGARIVLSGLVPLGMDIEQSDIGLQARSFGASLRKHISQKVTHLVISSDRPRTQKVRLAARIPSIKIVNQHWLADCFSQWTWLDETPYLIHVHPADRERAALDDAPSEVTDSGALFEQENKPAANGKTRLKIRISRSRSKQKTDGGNDDNDDDDDSTGDGDDGDNDDNDESDENDGSLLDAGDDDTTSSPIAELGTFDWRSADDELAMFLAEDGDDEEDIEREGEGDGDEDGDDVDDNDDDDNDLEAAGDDDGDGMDTEGGNDGSENKNMDALALKDKAMSKRKLTDDTDNDSEASSPSRDQGRGRGRSLFKKRQKLGGDAQNRSVSTLRQSMTVSAKKSASDAANAPKTSPVTFDIDEDQLEAMLMAELEEDDAAGAES